MLTRREFLRLCAATAGSCFLSDTLFAALGDALWAVAATRPPVLYLETITCAGDIFSLLNATKPDFVKLLMEVIDLRAEYSVMGAEGHLALETILRTAEEQAGEFILVVEGTPMTRAHGRYGVIGEARGRRWTAVEAVREVAAKAKHVVTSGTCAAYGGPYAARPNPAGAVPVSAVTNRPVINVPGCPVHPDWLVGTLVHLIFYGPPPLDRFGRPLLFFGRTVHDHCILRADFENGHFARRLGDQGCLYLLGCKGPVSFCDVPKRRWGDHLNWYIESGSPCIGCTEPGFPDRMEPFFAHLPDVGTPGVHVAARSAALVAAGATGAAVAGHLGLSLAKGRLQKHVLTYAHRQHHPESAGSPPQTSEPAGLTAGDHRRTPEERRQAIERALERAFRRGERRR
ncbi:MAG TPA: hydrogenase small subunit [Firmicutes bacterium]|nr:hydrogenase small subunit [Bacillota bacterium]